MSKSYNNTRDHSIDEYSLEEQQEILEPNEEMRLLQQKRIVEQMIASRS